VPAVRRLASTRAAASINPITCCRRVDGCIASQSKRGEAGRFRFELWLRSDDAAECDDLARVFSDMLREEVSGWQLDFTSPPSQGVRYLKTSTVDSIIADTLGRSVEKASRLRGGVSNSVYLVRLGPAIRTAAAAPTTLHENGFVDADLAATLSQVTTRS
jgi:hypothetical protein